MEMVRCYVCGEVGHKMNNCPKAAWNKEKNVQGAGPRNFPTTAPQGRPPATGLGQPNRNSKKPQAGGRVYCLEAGEEDIEDPHGVVSGTLLVNTLPTRVLVDAGATHFFLFIRLLQRGLPAN